METEVSSTQKTQDGGGAGWTTHGNFKRHDTKLTASVIYNFCVFLTTLQLQIQKEIPLGAEYVNIVPPFPVGVNTFRSPGPTSNEPYRKSGKFKLQHLHYSVKYKDEKKEIQKISEITPK